LHLQVEFTLCINLEYLQFDKATQGSKEMIGLGRFSLGWRFG